MGSVQAPKCQFWYALFFLLFFIQDEVLCSTYQVGDLDGWGIPPSSNPKVYSRWSKYHNFKIGDRLFFLYPPSQDSVIQVTGESYDSCNLEDPILLMNDGNSLFNITRPGEYYFTSGVEGHCEKSQKLHISVYGNASFADSPADAPTAAAPSYPTAFGSIPMQGSAAPLLQIPAFFTSAATGILISLLVM